MGLSTELISQFAKITNDQKKSRIDEATLYGEVIQSDDSICVKFDGSEQLTPVTTIAEKDEEGNITNFKYGAASVKTGDRVSVSLKNHSATITGNLSDPPMGRAEVVETEDSILLKVDDKIKVQVDALGVKIDGLVEITNGLENGTTTIDGACIKTGTIDAQYLNLTGAIKFGDLDSDAQGKIIDAQDTANAANTAAGNAQSTANTANANANSALSSADSAYGLARAVQNAVAGWTYSGSTYIDGSKIMTGTVRASTLSGGTVQLLDWNGDTCGSLNLSSTSGGIGVALGSGNGMQFHANGNIYLESNTTTLSLEGGYVSAGGTLIPRNQTCGLGSASFPWSTGYVSSSVISTSDKNKKHNIEELPGKYVEMLDLLAPKRFKFNDGTSDRYHSGFIAQDVKEAMYACNIDSKEFGGWVRDIDADGNDIYMLRYEEFIAILFAKIKQMDFRIKELEDVA